MSRWKEFKSALGDAGQATVTAPILGPAGLVSGIHAKDTASVAIGGLMTAGGVYGAAQGASAGDSTAGSIGLGALGYIGGSMAVGAGVGALAIGKRTLQVGSKSKKTSKMT